MDIQLATNIEDVKRLQDEARISWEKRDIFSRLITAVFNSVCAHSDILSFFVAIYTHAFCAGLISLPLPGLVLLWGSLSNPRPSKFFWINMIYYTKFVILVKYVSRFRFWAWNQFKNELRVIDIKIYINIYFKSYKKKKKLLFFNFNTKIKNIN